MKKNFALFKMMKQVLLYCFTFSLFFIGCTDQDLTDLNLNEDITDVASTRSAFDYYFDWDRLDKFSIYNPNTGKIDLIEIPWRPDSNNSLGIPLDWIDPGTYDKPTSNRYYSRENYWVLVYSNFMENVHAKYFALYNTRTGLMRFFFYSLSNASGGRNSFWGIKHTNSSSLFNFTRQFAMAADVRPQDASFISSAPGITNADAFEGVGYQVNNWYGIEVECAYDPNIKNSNAHNFQLKGWGAESCKITGSGITHDNITGAIEYAAPSTTFYASLSSMLNTNDSYKIFNINNTQGVVDGLTDKIEEGISKKDSFFKGLWNNIKRKAGTGVGDDIKSGLTTLVSSGGSFATTALRETLSSITGIGGSKPSVGKADLALSSTTSIELTGETNLTGYGGVTPFPIPGSSSNPSNMPLYNEPLGVWNLSRTPKILIEGISYNFYINSSRPRGVTQMRYFLDCSINDLVINEAIRNNVTVKNFKTAIGFTNTNYILDGNDYSYNAGFYPSAFMNNRKYYAAPDGGIREDNVSCIAVYGAIFERDDYVSAYSINPTSYDHGTFKAIVSFDLVDNATGKVYSFAKWFNTDFGRQKISQKSIRLNDNQYYNFMQSLRFSMPFPSLNGYNVTYSEDLIQ